MKHENEVVSFWNFYDDGYVENQNWVDRIGKVVDYEPVEIQDFGGVRNVVREMPIILLANGRRVRYSCYTRTYMFSEKELQEQLKLERNGEQYVFENFEVHLDSETQKAKDYLYAFRNVKTEERVLLKPQVHDTQKFEMFKVYFDFEPKF